MNTNTSGALLVAILAAAGFLWSSPLTVWACIATCAAAFLAEQFAVVGASPFKEASTAFAALSWIAVAVAILTLI